MDPATPPARARGSVEPLGRIPHRTILVLLGGEDPVLALRHLAAALLGVADPVAVGEGGVEAVALGGAAALVDDRHARLAGKPLSLLAQPPERAAFFLAHDGGSGRSVE